MARKRLVAVYLALCSLLTSVRQAIHCRDLQNIVGKKSLIGVEVMDEPNLDDKNKFLYPRSRYYGQVKPENLVFNANLQEFAQKVAYITSLETNGKLDPEDAYKKIKALWKELKSSKKTLFIGEEPPEKS